MKNKLLSIIIVNFNGERFLKNCINSIHQNCLGIDYEIVLVDNNSSDKSISLIKEEFPSVILIENKENDGFAKGNNSGVSKSHGEFVLLLNIDTILLDNLQPAIDLLKTDISIGSIGIKMLSREKVYRQSAGYFPSPAKLLKFKSMMIQTSGFRSGNFDFTKKFFPVDWVEASFLLTKKSLWDELKGMDETFFMYVEDIDYCKRLSYKNKKTVYLPELKYIHFGGFNLKRNTLLIKGLIHYVNIHFFGIEKWLGHINIKINYLVKRYVKKSV